MGKHTAGEDATVHPLVADALARRSPASAGAHGRDGADEPAGTTEGGSTGWPGPPPAGGEPVGWPEETGPERGAAEPDGKDRSPDDGVTDRSVDVPGRRRGWRRLLGARAAA